MPIKTVRKRELKSGNQHQIQLGGVGALRDAAPLSASVMQQLLAAKNETEFWAVNQEPAARPPVSRAGLPARKR